MLSKSAEIKHIFSSVIQFLAQNLLWKRNCRDRGVGARWNILKQQSMVSLGSVTIEFFIMAFQPYGHSARFTLCVWSVDMYVSVSVLC